MITIKGPHLTETLAESFARKVFTVDPLAVVTFDSNGITTVTIKCEKESEVLNALDLVPRSLLQHEREGRYRVHVLG